MKIHRFDHERIPERVVHARGAGAFGTFKLYESAEGVTSAKVLTDTSRTTPVILRFSTVLGSRGSADTVRDVRGFDVKFYTEEGNWDIVGESSIGSIHALSCICIRTNSQRVIQAIISLYSLYRTPSNSPTWSTQVSPSLILRYRKLSLSIKTFGTSNFSTLKPLICLCGLYLIAESLDLTE